MHYGPETKDGDREGDKQGAMDGEGDRQKVREQQSSRRLRVALFLLFRSFAPPLVISFSLLLLLSSHLLL